ncbi:MAG: VCBS repeat-containing protein [Candidatus Thermoplasmatota archaeon]|nr:VCBS repeat-containing protein [Candidatus Thermoplasmatota archaeon]
MGSVRGLRSVLLVGLVVVCVHGSMGLGAPWIPDSNQHDSEVQVLWWYQLAAPSFGSAAVGDIDEDGSLEIVFGTYFNDEHVYALNAENGSLLWSYDTGGCNDASPVIADVDLDGHLDVVIPASSPSMVYCFNGSTGQVKWARSTGASNCIDSPPAVADVDNDGKPEVILGTFYGNVFCLNGEDGSITWQKNLGSTSYIQSCPAVVDVDNDGQLDVVVAQWAGDCRVYALRGNNGSVLWYSDLPQDYMYHGASFADLDEDGLPELVIGCYDSHVYAFNGEDGSLAWEYIASYYIGAPTSLGDLNNDGYIEVVCVSYNKLIALSHTGSLLWSYSTGGNMFRGAALADVDGGDILDVVFGSDDGILRAVRGTDGQVVWTYDLQAHYGQTFEMDHAPVIADFNNDGTLDVFIVGGYGTSNPPTNNHGRAYALTAGDGTGAGWPMFRHDAAHSACFEASMNQPPLAPNITGPGYGRPNVSYTFCITVTDPNGDDLYCNWDWGDGTSSGWLGPYPSGQMMCASHAWAQEGTYEIVVHVKDQYGTQVTSEPFPFIVDGTPPALTLVTPQKQALYVNDEYRRDFFVTLVLGAITLEAEADDTGCGVENVSLYIDRDWKATFTEEPYCWLWSTTAFFRHTISVVAFDRVGNNASMQRVVWKFF